ncbi:TPA: hypothetical protein ACP32N_005028 [Pseudomonas aeruginosa]
MEKGEKYGLQAYIRRTGASGDQAGAALAGDGHSVHATGPAGLTVPEAVSVECKRLISTGQAIQAVKQYRAAAGFGLQHARRALGLGLENPEDLSRATQLESSVGETEQPTSTDQNMVVAHPSGPDDSLNFNRNKAPPP